MSHHNALFGWYPYVACTVFLLGSLLRFDHSQYTWRTGSSQLLAAQAAPVGLQPVPRRHPGDLRRPFVGLLTPIAVFDALGI